LGAALKWELKLAFRLPLGLAPALSCIMAAAVGISAILMTSAVAFTALKWAGAAYLVYIGVRIADT
jgi:threonine/homoserine/homoserine lactone efflux protein